MVNPIRTSDAANVCFKQKGLVLSEVARDYLEKSKLYRLDPQEGLILPGGDICNVYNPSLLSIEDLLSVYEILKGEEDAVDEPSKRVIKILRFDLADMLLCKIDEELKAAPNAMSQIAKQALDQLPEGDLLKTQVRNFILDRSAFGPSQLPTLLPLRERPIKVLTCTVETERNSEGGVGFVVRGLNRANKKLNQLKKQNGIDPSKRTEIRSLIPLCAKDKAVELNEAAFQGTIRHKYQNGDVVSSVYKNGKTGEWLIQPDPRYRMLFNIPLTKGVYASNKTSNIFHRACYIGSAFAATCLQYTGKNGKDRIDVAQVDYFWAGSIAFTLFQEARAQKHPIPKGVFVMHHGILSDKWEISEYDMRSSGVTCLPKDTRDPMSIGMRSACDIGAVLFVSPAMASFALSEDPTISAGRNKDLQKEKVRAILNGAEGFRFDPSNREVFKELALEKTFDANGNETTDFVAYRNRIKELLYRAGYLADPKKDVVVNFGRFDHYKATDVVRYVLDRKLPPSVQFVVMGAGDGEKTHVDRIKTLAETTHKQQLRIIDNIEKQRETLKIDGRDTGVPIGALVRVVAKLYFLPSHGDSCPLSGMEALFTGAPIVSPSQKDIGYSLYMDPVGKYSLLKDANSFGYPDHKNRSEATKVLFGAIKEMGKLSTEQQNQIARRISRESLRKLNWFFTEKQSDGTTKVFGQVLQYNDFYENLVQPQSKIDGKNLSQNLRALDLANVPLTSTYPSARDPLVHLDLAQKAKNTLPAATNIIFATPVQNSIVPVVTKWTWKNFIPRIAAKIKLFFQKIFFYISTKWAEFKLRRARPNPPYSPSRGGARAAQ